MSEPINHEPTPRPLNERFPLPEGYVFAGALSVTAGEMAELFNQVAIGENVSEAYMGARKKWAESIGATWADSAVRDSTDHLVGYSGLVFKGDNGILGDLVVSPAHQGRGIGPALLVDSLAKAFELGITSLSTYLEPTNTLQGLYSELGFRQAEPPQGETPPEEPSPDDSPQQNETEGTIYMVFGPNPRGIDE